MHTEKRAIQQRVYLFCYTLRRTAPRIMSLVLLVASILHPAGAASAQNPSVAPITSSEEQRLRDQSGAVRRFELPLRGRKYLGALSYQVTEHSCERVWTLLEEPVQHFAQALPATRSVEHAADNDPNKLLVTHGNAFVSGSYTVDFVSDREQYVARFWLDHSRPKDVQDVFGYVRLKDFGPTQCLITVAVAVDPGSGVLASMVRGTIHDYLLKSAGRFVRYARKTLPKESTRRAAHASNLGE